MKEEENRMLNNRLIELLDRVINDLEGDIKQREATGDPEAKVNVRREGNATVIDIPIADGEAGAKFKAMVEEKLREQGFTPLSELFGQAGLKSESESESEAAKNQAAADSGMIGSSNSSRLESFLKRFMDAARQAAEAKAAEAQKGQSQDNRSVDSETVSIFQQVSEAREHINSCPACSLNTRRRVRINRLYDLIVKHYEIVEMIDLMEDITSDVKSDRERNGD